ncbi:MAG: hypothetical protein KDD73_16050 [Anaerolineales bacterium]|nr:hypothetical protein [Anaerolineales bacterium]MCB9128313.1 hypothetical protein [Ardenticatenales bacterium]MCB9172126.1 hypothetical protein [Ardenticatenales bacterium]
MSAQKRLSTLIALLLIVVSLTVSAVYGQEEEQTQDEAEASTIILTSTGYDPPTLTIDLGTQVTWKNSSGESLELVAVGDWFTTIELANGSQYSKTPTTVGELKYYTRTPGSTTVNPNQGTIIVQQSGTPSPSPTGTLSVTPTPSRTATASLTATATTSVSPSLTPTASVTPNVSATPTETPTTTPTWTPVVYYPTSTPYPTPVFPTTGDADSGLSAGRSTGLGLLLLLGAVAVGMLYRRLRPDIGYRDSDYEWRN